MGEELTKTVRPEQADLRTGAPLVHPERANNIGLLRLCLALMVICSHSSQMFFDDPNHEFVIQTFGTIDLGGIAVDFFFIISGYLVTKSFMQRRSLWDYTKKRVLRIVPAFVVCYLVCFFVAGPFLGGDLKHANYFQMIHRLVRLEPPVLVGAFNPLHHKFSLDGAMWSIGYEARCYMLAALVGLAGLYARRRIYLALTGVMLALSMIPRGAFQFLGVPVVIPEIFLFIRMTSLFMCGACFLLFRDRIKYHWLGAVAAGLLILVGLTSEELFNPVFGICGSYLIFWLSYHQNLGPLRHINNKNDISYGVYLYAWPIAEMLLASRAMSSEFMLFALTVCLAIAAGLVSWFVVEKPALRLKSVGWWSPFAKPPRAAAAP